MEKKISEKKNQRRILLEKGKKKNREEILHEKKKTLKSKEIDFTLKKSSTCIQMVFRVTIFHSYQIILLLQYNNVQYIKLLRTSHSKCSKTFSLNSQERF